MHEYGIAIFDTRTRIKELEELIYPSIFYSSWRTEREKIRAMYRHKIRIGKSIVETIGGVEEKEELSDSLDSLYLDYVALFGFSSVEVKKCEAEVEAEVKKIEAKAYFYAYASGESAAEVYVSNSTKWVKARVAMLFAQVMKKSYTHQVYARGELAMLKMDLGSLERKLSEEPDSQIKADIMEEIEKVKELLFSLGK